MLKKNLNKLFLLSVFLIIIFPHLCFSACETHYFGGPNTEYYIYYGSGTSWNFTATNSMNVNSIETTSYLAAVGYATFYIDISINGTTVASGSQYVTSSTYLPYTLTQNVSVNLNSGDTITYNISSNWYSARSALYGDQNYVKLCSVELPEGPPFGSFDSPIDGSTVASSIAVTGWALDDNGIEYVKIYRIQGNTLVYIGDAMFVEGARPDVAVLYPQYPNNTLAGWGYMMLTNFLPNGGNGTFVLYAIATDTVGTQTILGTKTIYCDNDHAVKPFGAIDTPSQGGTSSGSSFINWGWVLTPQPNSIPTDGSTINVYVDGVSIGHPTYNIYRSDLASLFPGYFNSNGAAGYFYLDTTAYADGVHTIQWTARDTGGNTDGIGSRYFSIDNDSSDSGMRKQSYNYLPKQKTTIHNLSQISELPIDYSAPVRFKQGYNEDTLSTAVSFDESGMNRIVIEEMERIEIHLSDHADGYSYNGYLTVGDRMMALPVGSTLNPKTGVFSWIPGPGHLGRFHLVFVGTGQDGTVTKKNIIVEILPKQYKVN